jgi:hypothetical protein
VAVNDYRETGVKAGIRYGRASIGTISLFGGYTRSDTPDHPVGYVGSEGYEEQTAGVTVERRIGARIQAAVTVNYFNVDLLTPSDVTAAAGASDHFDGVGYSGVVDYRVTGRLALHATLQRSVQPTLLIGRPVEIDTGYSAHVDYRIGSRIFTTLGADHNESDTHSVPSDFADSVLTKATIKGFFGSVRYQFSDRLSVTLDARNETRNANLSQYNYTNNRIGLAVAVLL